MIQLPILSLTDEPAALAQKLGDSFSTYGFAMIKDHGLDPALVRQGWDKTAEFFALPTEQWASYLRVDTTVADVTRAMRGVFSSVPWPVRRRLATASPLPFARLLR